MKTHKNTHKKKQKKPCDSLQGDSDGNILNTYFLSVCFCVRFCVKCLRTTGLHTKENTVVLLQSFLPGWGVLFISLFKQILYMYI